LEFNVPFQHKYGYMRDKGKLVKDLYSANVLKRIRARKYLLMNSSDELCIFVHPWTSHVKQG